MIQPTSLYKCSRETLHTYHSSPFMPRLATPTKSTVSNLASSKKKALLATPSPRRPAVSPSTSPRTRAMLAAASPRTRAMLKAASQRTSAIPKSPNPKLLATSKAAARKAHATSASAKHVVITKSVGNPASVENLQSSGQPPHTRQPQRCSKCKGRPLRSQCPHTVAGRAFLGMESTAVRSLF